MIGHLPFISGDTIKCAFNRSILLSSDQMSLGLQCFPSCFDDLGF